MTNFFLKIYRVSDHFHSYENLESIEKARTLSRERKKDQQLCDLQHHLKEDHGNDDVSVVSSQKIAFSVSGRPKNQC